MDFKLIYESAKNERAHNLREDNASYEMVDPVEGLQPAKKWWLWTLPTTGPGTSTRTEAM
jgi:hypothetical protein